MISHAPGISLNGVAVLHSVIAQGLGPSLSPEHGTALLVDTAGIIAETGGSIQHWPGRLNGMLTGTGLLGVIVDRFHLPVVDALEAALVGETVDVSCLGLHFDGSDRRVTLTFTPVRDQASGDVLGAIIRAQEATA